MWSPWLKVGPRGFFFKAMKLFNFKSSANGV
jgi:hypothetical protein